VQVDAYSPMTVTVTLDQLVTESLPVTLVEQGEPAVGFQAGSPELSHTAVYVSGPAEAVKRVTRVRALLDISGVKETSTARSPSRRWMPMTPLWQR